MAHRSAPAAEAGQVPFTPVPRASFEGLRVLVVHEWLNTWAGGERCLEQILGVFPDADLLVGVITDAMRDYNDVTRRARESWVGLVPGARTRHRWFLPLHAAAFATHDTSAYDLIISSSHAFEKFIRRRRRGDARHLCYCHSPPRWLWDLNATYAARATPMQRAALAAGAPFWRALDRRAARSVDRFVSNSRYVADRVRRCYGVESDVVYPPVVAKPTSGAAAPVNGPYLLALGRLVEYKRVDLLIRAAEQLRMKLIVAGDGPERRKLEQLGGSHTEFLGEVSEERAGDLLAGCSAFVFGGEEDFGIALVEANAHGRPVVCLGRGGALESMIEGKTAVFFNDPTVDSAAAAIQTCLSRHWDVEALHANARRFSPEEFRAGLCAAITRVVAS